MCSSAAREAIARKCAAATRMVAGLAAYIDHARLHVGGTVRSSAAGGAKAWNLGTATRVGAALVEKVDHSRLLVGGTSRS